MAPVLFLFMMNAFAESLETKWKQKELPAIKVMMHDSNNIGEGQVCSHTPAMYESKSLTLFEIYQCLYVDDGAFPFATRPDMITGMNFIYHHLALFGLEMHIGRHGKESKTECMFFPPSSIPQFIAEKEAQHVIATTTMTANMIDSTTSTNQSNILTITTTTNSPTNTPTDSPTKTPTSTPNDFPVDSRINIINHPKLRGKHGVVKKTHYQICHNQNHWQAHNNMNSPKISPTMHQ